MSYSKLLNQLYHINQSGGMKLGLSNALKLDQACGYPSKAYPTIHVGGTNGKGSVTTKIASAFAETGKKVGLYTSPHISCFRERIQINGQMISEQDVEKHLLSLFETSKKENISPTFFELTTLLAFKYFADQQVDLAVIEVGLGGRFDATNILSPKLAIITSISLDHTNILGSTIEEIALEKAGIIKEGIPVVLGPHLPLKILQEYAMQKNSPCIGTKGSFATYEEENQHIASEALNFLNVPTNAIQKGILKKPPCRFETHTIRNKTVILDVAHNPDGMLALLKMIQNNFPNKKMHAVLGISANKDILGNLQVIKEAFHLFHLVTAPNRGIQVALLESHLLNLGVLKTCIQTYQSISEAMRTAFEKSCEEELIIVCGTFFIMGEVRQFLGIEEPKDAYSTNEFFQK